MVNLKNPVLKIVLLIILVFIILNNLLFFPSNILCWDVFGYYLYLPLKFIYHDMGLRDESVIPSILEQYHNSATFYQAVKLPDGGYVMKYTMGLAILYSPFFFIGHIIAELSAYAADGFSAPYQYSIFFGSILYSMLAVIVLSRVLMRFFTERISAIILIIVVFSTNYIIHITMSGQNANSYNYLFLAYALILWYTILWHETHKLKHMVFLAIACGITILSRPSEVVCLAIPVFWGVASKKTLVQKIQLLLKNYYQVLIFVGILALIGSFQFIYWKIHTGKFLYNSYGGNPGEGFEFLTPYLSKVLFSFRKGWLIYTPVMVFAILGFLVMFRRNRTIFFSLGAYLILNLYLVSSWSNWWYTQSFSQRAMIPSYPVMAVSLGYFLVWLFEQKRVIKTAGLVLLSGLLILNIFQTVQYANGTIHGDRMTRAYYFAVFGKLNASEEDRNLLLVDRTFESKESFTDQTGYTSRLWKSLDFEQAEPADTIPVYSGNYAFSLDTIHIYSPAIESSYEELTIHDHAWIRITAFVYPTEDIIQNPFSLVVHFTHNEYPYKYRGYNSEDMDLQLNQWNRITFDYLTPEVRRKDNLLKIYFWNRGTGQIFIDDFQVEVFEKER
jgi:hypothetical protein